MPNRSESFDDDGSERTKLTLYYGSQTGTAEGFAKTLATESKRFAFKPSVCDLEDFDVAEMQEKAAAGELVMFCMATYGEGDPTDNAQAFHEWMVRAYIHSRSPHVPTLCSAVM